MVTLVASLLAVVIFGGVCRVVFKSWVLAALGAVLLVSSPLFRESLSASVMRPLPFAIAWLWLIDRIDRRPEERGAALLAGAVLGLGIYAHDAALVAFTLFFLLTLILLVVRNAPRRCGAAAAAGFALSAMPLLIYVALHPEWWNRRVMALALYDATRFNVWQGAREMTSWVALTARFELYWDYLDPAFLFWSGLVLSPWLIIPLVAGTLFVLARSRRAADFIAVAAFGAGPVAGALAGGRPVASRLVLILPFATVLAVHGSIQLWELLFRVISAPPGRSRTRKLPGGASGPAA